MGNGPRIGINYREAQQQNLSASLKNNNLDLVQ